MKNKWSVSDGNSFEVYVKLNDKDQTVSFATFDCGKTETLGHWTFQAFLDLQDYGKITHYLGQTALDEMLATVAQKVSSKK